LIGNIAATLKQYWTN